MIRAFVPDSVNALGYMLLLFVGVLLPVLIFRSARKLGSRPLPVSRSWFFRQTVIFQLVLALLCASAAWTNGILIMPLPERPLISSGAAVLLYLVMLATLKLRWKSRSSAAKQRLYDILPRTSAEFGEYVLLCIVAGVAEEFIYRGVLTGLLQRITGIATVTVITLSVSFAVAHSMQGLRSNGSKRTVVGSKRAIDGSKRTVDGSKRAIDGSKRTVDGSKRTIDGSKRTVDGQKEPSMDQNVPSMDQKSHRRIKT
jgi:membrane protease YdiL (CAAX protease family)